MEKLLEIMEELKPGYDFSVEEDLVKDGILDSMSIVQLVSEIAFEWDVTVPVTELVPENFSSAREIYALVQRLLDEE